jgi:hypothetical protein
VAAPSTFNFTTGPATLPDVGTLSYNGCVFSPLYETSVHGAAVEDDAKRTIKYMEYTITADGYVTLPAGAADISPTMTNLCNLLTMQGAQLVYLGRGMDLVVNAPGGGALAAAAGAGGAAGTRANTRDVAWGPVPKLLEFQPLGGGLSAKVRWQVTVRIPEVPPATAYIGASLAGMSPWITNLLQFNYESSVTYGEDGYSTLSVKGTMEIPLTRRLLASRISDTTVDSVRAFLEYRVFRGVDLNWFRVTKRNFNVSRDKRKLEWDFTAEEIPYMDLPQYATVARGTYSVRPASAGMGLCKWLCTLRATYTIRSGQPRRRAWFAFLNLLRLRMRESDLAYIPILPGDGGAAGPSAAALNATFGAFAAAITNATFAPTAGLSVAPGAGTILPPPSTPSRPGNAWLIDFSVDEGLYLDSKTTSFSATWRTITTFSHILLASGLWRKVPERPSGGGGSYWAASMRLPGSPPSLGTAMNTVMGSQSWLRNKVSPSMDVIVDFGGG